MKLTKFKQQISTHSIPELIAERDQTIIQITQRPKISSQLVELKKKLAIIHTQLSIKEKSTKK
jgi:hypothetical protein